MKNIVISGYYGSKNAGDEAMLAAMIEVLSDLDPKLHIKVISANPVDTKRRHGVESIPWLSLLRIWKALGEADLLLSGGGSLLQNVTSKRSLYYYLSIIFMAQLRSVPVMLYAQGIGPILGFAARKIMQKLCNRSALITVRDQGSLSELLELGIDKPPIEATADPVLAIHPVTKDIGHEILKWNNADGIRPVIGISVREWKGWKHYKEMLAKAADQMVHELGARVVFLPMQYPEDVKVAQLIHDMMQEDSIVLDAEYTTSELLSIVGNMDLLVSIRLHALIFAGVMGVPMVGLSYDPKIDRFLSSVGEHAVGDLQATTVDALMKEVRIKWGCREECREKNRALLAPLRHLAAKNAELALGILRKH
ncbi:polysaccharide pyruvyl transferase CsaB [Selenomonas sp. TAMA-11512]|uniref:polysaccharide pyruvyl transferase CsaB n=1 Tax=Selenomonas sp. TAMA-11512 TaxID=3095337 RepID=UPI003084BCA2|nr:polysaccharide pyruvyl transferase CsaB [Selenomonas sp. TAMA-11512]